MNVHKVYQPTERVKAAAINTDSLCLSLPWKGNRNAGRHNFRRVGTGREAIAIAVPNLPADGWRLTRLSVCRRPQKTQHRLVDYCFGASAGEDDENALKIGLIDRSGGDGGSALTQATRRVALFQVWRILTHLVLLPPASFRSNDGD